jgi:drug/metabolite transporter (DMT)-like permease
MMVGTAKNYSNRHPSAKVKLAGMPPAQERPIINPYLALPVAVLSVSTAAIFIRYAQQEAPSLVIAAYRLTLAALLLAPIALTRYRDELRSLSRRRVGLALLSGIFLAFHFATWITSLEYTTVASSVVLVTTVPLWVALIAPFALREPITRSILIGMGLALVGGLVVGLNDACTWQATLVCPSLSEMVRGQAFWGDLLALAGAVMAALYLIIGRRLRERLSLVSYIFLVYGMAAIVLLVMTQFARQPLLGYQPTTYLWLLLLALIPQLFGHSTYNWSLRYVSTAVVSITLLGEPIGSTILAIILLREAPTPLKIFGAILILAGIYIASLGESRRARAAHLEVGLE